MGEVAMRVASVSVDLNKAREREVLDCCRAGDWSDYRLIVARYRRLVWAAVDAVLCGDALVDDVVQEVFIRTYEKLHTFRGTASFSSWLYRLARNHAIGHLRKITRRPRLSSLDDGDSGLALTERLPDSDRPDHGYAVDARRMAVGRMVTDLPREYREVVNLYYLDELSYEGIAEVLRLSLNTVKTRLRRARIRLQQQAKSAGWC